MEDKLVVMREATLCFLVSRERVRLAEMLGGPFAGVLNGYGGGLEPTDNDILSATLRELSEESGVQGRAQDLHKAAVVDSYRYKENEWRKMRVFVSLLPRWIGIPSASSEMGPPEEYTPEELPLERMMLGDRLWLPRLLKGARLHAEIWYGPEQKSFDRQPIVSQLSIKELDRLWVRP